MAEEIITALQKGKYDGRSQEISDYLSGTFKGKAAASTKHLCLHAVRFLYIYTTDFDKLPEAEIAGVLKAVQNCCIYIQTNSHNIKDSQSAEKLLYHVLSKAIKKSYLAESIELSKCLSVFLQTGDRQDDANAQKIAHSTFTTLWNGATQVEKDPNANHTMCFQMRHQALFHLLISGRGPERGQVVSWTIDHYNRTVSKLELDKASVAKACCTVETLVQDLGEILQIWLSRNISIGDAQTYIRIGLQMYLRLSAFLLMHGNTTDSNASHMSRLTAFFAGLNVDKQDKILGKVYSAVPYLVQAGLSLTRYSSVYSLSGTVKKCEDITSGLEKANTQLQLLCKCVKSGFQISLLHSVLCFSLQIPEDTSTANPKTPRFDFSGMPEKVEERVLSFYSTIAKFYEAAAEVLAKGEDKKLLSASHFCRIKTLQLKLNAMVTKVDRQMDMKENIAEELTSVYMDLSRVESALSASSSDEKSLSDDIYQLATVSYKFGRLCFARRMYSDSVGFLKICTEQFTRWIKVSKAEKPPTLNLWKRYEMLADSHRKTGHVEAGLRTIADGLVIEPEQLAHIVDMWVRFKIDTIKNNPTNTNTKSLWSYISDRQTPLTAYETLNAELSIYKKYKSSFHEMAGALLEELLAVTPDSEPEKRACVLLEKAALLWATRADTAMSPAACCETAISLLEGALVGDRKRPRPTIQNQLARACLWHHVVSDVDPLRLRDEMKERKSADIAQAASTIASFGDDGDTAESGGEAYHDCCTLDMEQEASRMADRALELWEQLVSSGSHRDILLQEQLQTTIDSVSVLADVYRLTHRIREEHRALTVLHCLCALTEKSLVYLRVQTDLIHIYIRLHQPHLAAPLVSATRGWLQNDKPKACLATVQHIVFLIVAAEANLLNGQVRKGCELLNEAVEMKTEHFRRKSTDALTLDARIYRLAATILSLPPGCHDDDGRGDCCHGKDFENALELELKASRSISGVVCYALGEWLVTRRTGCDKVPVSTLNKWSLLDELLTSLYSTGSTCVQLGEQQEAKCYLQQGLKLAQGFHLPRRFAAFHLELSKLNNLSAKFTTSQSHINVAYYTLNSKDPALRLNQGKSDARKSTSNIGEDSDDEMEMKMRPIEMSEVLEEDGNESVNVIGSPVSRRWKPRAPDSWSHGDKCDCVQCMDVIAQGLQLQHMAQQAYCLFKQGLNSQAEQFWNLLLKNFDVVTNRARHTLLQLVTQKNRNMKAQNEPQNSSKAGKKCGGTGNKTVAYQDPNVNPSMFQRLLVSVCQHLTEHAISEKDWDQYNQWVSKAEELLAPEKYPWMIPCYHMLAEIVYLTVDPYLPLPKVEEKSDLQELCERIGGVKIVSARTDSQKEIHETLPSVSETPSAEEKAKEKPTKLQPKLTGRVSKRGSKTPANPVSRVSKTTETGASSPARINGDDRHSVTSDIKVIYTTPARKMRPPKSQVAPASDIAVVKDKDKSVMSMFKTPRSVSGRRAMLDILINSDSDEEILKSSKSSAMKKQPPSAKSAAPLQRRATARKGSTIVEKSSATPNVKFDLLSPSGANKIKGQAPVNKLKVDSIPCKTPSKSPVAALFKASLNRSVAMEMGSENVFDFIPSSPEGTPAAARGKKKPGKPGRKAASLRPKRTGKTADQPDIEVKREIWPSPKVHPMQTDPVRLIELKSQEVITKNAQKSAAKPLPEKDTLGKKGQASVPLRPRLTRAKTSIRETNREADLSGDDSFSGLDCSGYIPEDEESSHEMSDILLSPERLVDVENDNLSSTSVPQELPLIDALTSPIEIARQSYDKPLAYMPQFETVEEEKEDTEPVEVRRGYDSGEEGGDVKSRGKNVRKLQPKPAGKVKHKQVSTEVPRLARVKTSSRKVEEPIAVSPKPQECNEEKNNARSMSMRDISSHLTRAFSLLAQHPAPIPYRKICHGKVLVELNQPKPDPWTLAYYLTESQSVAFRHTALGNINKKIKKLHENSSLDADSESLLSRLKLTESGLRFSQSVSDLKQSIDTLPKEWTVVQISVATTVRDGRGYLVMTQFTSGNDPIVVHLPGYATKQGQKLLNDCASIIKSNIVTMSLTNRVEWWTQRNSLNEKLKETLEEIEVRWLGCWVGLLQGQLANTEDNTRLEEAIQKLTQDFTRIVLDRPINTKLVKVLLRSYHLLSERHVGQLIGELCGVKTNDGVLNELVSMTSRAAKSLNLAASTRSDPVILILDKEIQHLPWESLPSMRSHPFSRMPSLYFLSTHHDALNADKDSVFNVGIDQKKTFYVLNPDDNLESTQTTFEHKFGEMAGWKGVVGKPPTSVEFTEGVTQHDLFVYCGHGSGSKFLPGSTLASLQCRAAVLLMGCSSGKLTVDGQLEASGLMLSYFLAGCPSIVACLWDVTDRDIDRYLEELLSRSEAAKTGMSLLECVQQSRDVCRLPYLIGAAPVVYGLPVSLKSSS